MSGDGTQGGGSTTPQQGAQMAPFMPGQQDALSQQLSAGFGQSANDISAWLDQVHKPTQMPAPANPGRTPDRPQLRTPAVPRETAAACLPSPRTAAR